MGLIYLILIAFLDDTIDKASEIDTYATVDGIDSALPCSWAQVASGSTVTGVWWGGWGIAAHLGWNWEGDGLHVDIVFLLDIFEHFMPRLEADAVIANIQVNDNKTLFK